MKRRHTFPFGPPVIRWLLFGVALSMIPVIIASIGNAAIGEEPWAYVYRGDLLLVSAVLGGTALGELVGAPTPTAIDTTSYEISAILAGGAVAASIFGAALLYPLVNLAAESEQFTLDASAVAICSLLSLLLTIFSGANCIEIARKAA